MKKGPFELRSDEEEGESESKVTNQIFGRPQHPKNEVRYLENILFRLLKRFSHIRGVSGSIYKNENCETHLVGAQTC